MLALSGTADQQVRGDMVVEELRRITRIWMFIWSSGCPTIIYDNEALVFLCLHSDRSLD